MAQKTNLNINPYFDDFNADKNYYKVLFNPGRPIQSRELNTIQSILQNQIESFGSHIFKEGSMVIPGGTHYDSSFHAVKLNTTSFGVDINQYIEKYVGKKIVGQSSGLTAVVKKVVLPNEQIDEITLYVKYLTSGSNFDFTTFLDGESLSSTETIAYGINNTTISDGTPFASLVSTSATEIGSSVSIENGIYFVRGCFASVEKQTLILDYYTNISSYRVGLSILEEIVTAKDDSTLYDNASGFNNFSSPGADRFRIRLVLSKKSLTDFNDTNFIELLRVENGVLRKLETKTDYNLIKDYLAKRTYDESGNYTTNNFSVSLNSSLNNLLGNNGKYYDGDVTTQGNTPSDDLMCVTIGPGKAYVKGYDIQKNVGTVLDIEKPRDTEEINNILVPFDMGNILKVNNVYGSAITKSTVSFYKRRRGSSDTPTGDVIGNARVYLFKLSDIAYTGETSIWDLYLYDIRMYTELTLGTTLSSAEIKSGSRVVGQSSGAIGYSVSDGDGSNTIYVRQESGTFLQNETITIGGIDANHRSIVSIIAHSTNDIKCVYNSDYSTTFIADAVLDKVLVPGFNAFDTVTVDGSSLVSSKPLSGITTDTIIAYRKPGDIVDTYNRVTSVFANTLTLATTTATSGVNTGTLSATETDVGFRIARSSIKNPEKSYLYAILPNSNIASTRLSDSEYNFSSQALLSITQSSSELILSTSDFDLPADSASVRFNTFSPDRYSIHYSDGTIEPLTADQVTFNLQYTTVTFKNVSNSKTVSVVNGSFIKSGIQSKAKVLKKSNILDISLSKYEGSGSDVNSSRNDGLTYNRYYGLRVQDEEICLRNPDVSKIIAIYEEVSNGIIFDKLTFSATYGIQSNAIIGENIIGQSSRSVARIVGKSANTVEFVYLNGSKFTLGEVIKFEDSNINAELESITFGSYKNVTSGFRLNKGQKDEYYDYSSIVRNKNYPEPSRKLKVVYDYYDVSSQDNGDVYTVSSYTEENYGFDIPRIGKYNIRASDILDFRPRVAEFTGSSSSPFDFTSRTFSTSQKIFPTPNQASLISYNVYLARIDTLYLDYNGSFALEKGTSSLSPKRPRKGSDFLELASIILPPYLYDTSDAVIDMVDNKRFTMRDIGSMENRIEKLEKVTSLSLLELSTQAFQIKDSDGLDRFKTGFFADSFNDNSFIKDRSLCQVNEDGEMTPLISEYTIFNKPLTDQNITASDYDSTTNYKLLDPRVRINRNVVTLDYTNNDWIEQNFATRLENVNPFHVIQYVGDIRLNPFRDTWTRTEKLSDETIRHSLSLNLRSSVNTLDLNLVNQGGAQAGNQGLGENEVRDTFLNLNLSSPQVTQTERTEDFDTSTATTTETTFVDSKNDNFMRSRNTEFSSSNLTAFTRYYAFLDGNSSVDIVPKLVEVTSDRQLTNSGANGVFEIGEKVTAYSAEGDELGTFRLASPNHKSGPFNNPTLKYDTNPYNKEETLSEAYTQSSSVLNIDTRSLSDDATGTLYTGYITKGCSLVGENGALAYVKDIRLVTDNYGDLIGTFFIRDPNSSPPPPLRIPTGSKTFKLSSTPNNRNGLIGDTSISSAEASYVSEGTVNQIRNTTRVTSVTASLETINNIRTRNLEAIRQEEISTVDTPTPVINNITNITQNITQILGRQAHADPLAQTFLVGTARGLNSFNDDENGAFLTAVDLFFQSVDSGNAEITIQVRTTEFGIPTLQIIGDPVTLRPTDVVSGTTIFRDNVSEDGSVATRVTFPYPIFLPPGLEYAIVLMAPQSDEYRVFTARMGEKTISTQNLPDVESVRYTSQFAIGSLFKSQNGSTWTPDQYEDLKFKLYKANFTQTEGILYLGNSDQDNRYLSWRRLKNNDIKILPKKVKVGIDTITDAGLLNILSPGRKIGDASKNYVYGTIEKVGSKATAVGIDTGGRNYPSGSTSNVSTFNVTGNGSGLTLDITAGSNNTITGATPNNLGNGYAIGDVVGIVTSDVTGNSGQNALFTITSNSNSLDTLYLTNVSAQSFTEGVDVTYYDNGSLVSLANTHVTSYSSYAGDFYNGKHFKVSQFDHGMYAQNNLVTITGIDPDTPTVKLTSDLSSNGQAFNINSSDITYFSTFEGITVSSTNPGYIKIGSEIVQYSSAVGSEISGLNRGQFGTQAIPHFQGMAIQKYECGGVSLGRINRTHNIVDNGIEIDSYYVEIETVGTSALNAEFLGQNRSIDDGTNPELSFNTESNIPSSNAFATENILYDTITPWVDAIIPGQVCSIQTQLRSITGTSCDGTEVSFVDLGYENVQPNVKNKLNSIRMIASKPNADEYLTNIPRNRSQTLSIRLSTRNYNLSPMIFVDDASWSKYEKARISNPISNYIDDYKPSSILTDPHEASYTSKNIMLSQPSNTLKVILTAHRDDAADFRVMYSLLRPESGRNLLTYELFPGYNNLTSDLNQDGYLDVVDINSNSGLPDKFVSANSRNQFSEYEYTAPNVGPFIGFAIKIVMSSTKMDKYPRFRDIRAIALAWWI